MSTRQLKTIKGAKIESRKGDGVNHLVCRLGDKLISTFKRQKKAIANTKKLILAIAVERVPTYFLSSGEFFLMKLEKNPVTSRF